MSQHADRIRDIAESKSAAALSSIAASWSRSLLVHGLDPDQAPRTDRLDEVACREASERMGRLKAIAAPVMDRLFAAVGDGGCSVVLTDRDGVIVERRGKPGDDQLFKQWGLWVGARWGEHNKGTNGIGTCIVEQRPVTVHRDQHFYAANTAMSCMGAPIFDHEGAFAGVLDISSCRADLAEAFVSLLTHTVADAARAIEADNFQSAFSDNRILRLCAEPGAGSMLLAVDQDDLLVGATRRARRSFDLGTERLARERPVREVLGDAWEPDLEAAERAEIRRALAHAGGKAAQAARDLGISRASLYRRMTRLGVR